MSAYNNLSNNIKFAATSVTVVPEIIASNNKLHILVPILNIAEIQFELAAT